MVPVVSVMAWRQSCADKRRDPRSRGGLSWLNGRRRESDEGHLIFFVEVWVEAQKRFGQFAAPGEAIFLSVGISDVAEALVADARDDDLGAVAAVISEARWAEGVVAAPAANGLGLGTGFDGGEELGSEGDFGGHGRLFSFVGNTDRTIDAGAQRQTGCVTGTV